MTKWLVKKKECIKQNDHHLCGVIICMLAWKVVSNNRFELIDDHIKGREVVIDKYLELLNQCIEVKNNESINKSDEITELIDLSNVETPKKSNKKKLRSEVMFKMIYVLCHKDIINLGKSLLIMQ